MNSTDYEPWMFQPVAAYPDSWLSEALTRDAEMLTRALQKTISGDTNTSNTNNTYNNSDAFVSSSDAVSSLCKAETQSASGVSGSDPEIAATASRRRTLGKTAAVSVGAVTKKITKRKPRATKKCQTTVIMADPANFRQMVQQVTGVRFESLQHQQSLGQNLSRNQLIVKPEPKRLTGNGLTLPTLDTSSFFVDGNLISQQQQQEGVGVGFCGGGQRDGWLTGCDDVAGQVAYGDSLIGGGAGYGYESYQSFPTLESWN